MFVRLDDWKPTPGIALEGTALEVVKSTSSLSVLAGPGAGKTELLAQRATYLLNTGLCPPPKRILAIAFKVDAARNLLDRVANRCETQVSRRFESLTLHAFAKRTLDQFREALKSPLRPSPNYKIIFPNADSWSAFQDEHSAEHPYIRSLNPSQLARVVHELVPDFEIDDLTAHDRIRKLWWKTCIQQQTSALTFDMVMLLATHIVKTQPLVSKALANTYTHVFLDEFQDVTGQQYDLVRYIFQGTPAVLTAVGDTNQAIMAWAGALPDIFTQFARDFSAESRKLQFNFRSNTKIVGLINNLSELFASQPAVPTEAGRQNATSPPDALEGWVFPTRDSEGAGLAKFISASLVEFKNLRPHDFVILVRLRADVVEARLVPYFSSRGLRLRNEARFIGSVSIQDLVKDAVFLFLTALLKMSHGLREGSPFRICRDLLAHLDGLDIASEKGAAQSLRMVQQLVSITTDLTNSAPAEVDFEHFISIVLNDDRRLKLSRAYRDYQSREHLDSILRSCSAFFAECAIGVPGWAEFIASVEGRDVVKIMTIHKSKGLEYHTVIFAEFNDDAFWNKDDDLNVFFVALSRARERVRFSLTRDAKGFNNVARFIERLQQSGVEFKELE